MLRFTPRLALVLAAPSIATALGIPAARAAGGNPPVVDPIGGDSVCREVCK